MSSGRHFFSGWIADGFDERDKPYVFRGPEDKDDAGNFAHTSLLEKHPEWLESVYTQHKSGSCVANATAAAVRYLAGRHGELPDLERDPSRLFIYYNARVVAWKATSALRDAWPRHDEIVDLGCRTREAMKAVAQFGVAREQTWPFEPTRGQDNEIHGVKNPAGPDEQAAVLVAVPAHGEPAPAPPHHVDFVARVNDRPCHAAYVEASNTRALEYCRLDPDINDLGRGSGSDEAIREAIGVVTLARLKQCIVEGYPVVLSFRYYWKPSHNIPGRDPKAKPQDLFTFPDLPSPPERRAVMEELNGKREGHTVLAIGFRDAEPSPAPAAPAAAGSVAPEPVRGWVLCQNSWGPDSTTVSHTARFWLPYDWVRDYDATDDFWMVRLAQSPAASLPPPPCAPPVAVVKAAGNRSAGGAVVGDEKKKNATRVSFQTRSVASVIERNPSLGPSTDLVAVARTAAEGEAGGAPGEMRADVFWASPAGAVRAAHGGGGWEARELAGAGEGAGGGGGGMAAVSVAEGGVAVLWVASDLSVRCTYLPPTGDKNGPRTAQVGPPGSAAARGGGREGGGLVALSGARAPGLLDAFWVGPGGCVVHCASAPSGWGAPATLCGAGSAAEVSGLAALSLAPFTPGAMALLYVTPEGGLSARLWWPFASSAAEDSGLGSGSWSGEVVVLAPYSVDVASRLGCVLTRGGAIEAFCVAPHGYLRRATLPLSAVAAEAGGGVQDADAVDPAPPRGRDWMKKFTKDKKDRDNMDQLEQMQRAFGARVDSGVVAFALAADADAKGDSLDGGVGPHVLWVAPDNGLMVASGAHVLDFDLHKEDRVQPSFLMPVCPGTPLAVVCKGANLISVFFLSYQQELQCVDFEAVKA